MNRNWLLKGGRIVDPSCGRDEVADLRVTDGVIAAIGSLDVEPGEEVLSVDGQAVTPGLIDLCVHLREPGFESIETIRTGAASALAGGFTAIAAMPDTDPPVDNAASATYVRLKGEEARGARVYPVGALTQGRAGEELAELDAMSRAGAVAFSDEESCVDRTDIFVKALRYSAMLDRPVLTRCEDRWLRGRGVANSGLMSDLMGLPSVGAGMEEIMLARNLYLSRLHGRPLHLLHLTTSGSTEQLRLAKAENRGVTASVTPHHLVLDQRSLESFDPAFKYMPPLRTQEDREALVAGLIDGTIDAVTSAHTPRGENEKNLEFIFAEFGTGGLETAFPVLHTQLVRAGLMSLIRLVEVLSTAPARILGVPGGSLQVGGPADLTCFDLTSSWTVNPTQFLSRGKNSPFSGWNVIGRAMHVFVDGELRLLNGSQQT